MSQQKILLTIEAMSELDVMASAAAEHGYKLRVLAEDPDYYGENDVDIVKFPTRDYAELEKYILEHRTSISQVFSVTDTWGVIASKLRDKFEYYQFGDTSKLVFFRDKEAVQRSLIASGMALPSNRWPKIFKPRSGTGKIGVHLVESELEIDAIKKEVGIDEQDYLKQDFYFGPTYSAEAWKDSLCEIFFGVTNRILSQPPVFTERVKSFPWEANSVWEDKVKNWIFSVLNAVDYKLGLVHVEFIETNAGFELVEINPRMAGALITPGILKTTNFNPYAMAVNQALGIPLDAAVKREINCGFSHVSLYAPKLGTIDSIKGVENINRYPGQPVWFPSRKVGDTISGIGTYRARIGNLVATAETASLAQDRAICVSQLIEVLIKKAD